MGFDTERVAVYRKDAGGPDSPGALRSSFRYGRGIDTFDGALFTVDVTEHNHPTLSNIANQVSRRRTTSAGTSLPGQAYQAYITGHSPEECSGTR